MQLEGTMSSGTCFNDRTSTAKNRSVLQAWRIENSSTALGAGGYIYQNFISAIHASCKCVYENEMCFHLGCLAGCDLEQIS